jgi:mono/diheme cytochrome c family protein/glucose/arabinose dehydrogenase
LHRLRLAALTATLAAALPMLASPPSAAQEDDEPLPSAGLVGRYEAAGFSCLRVDGNLSFDWSKAPPDRRLPPGPFQAEWSGRILVMEPGQYQFQAFAAGKLRIEIDGKQVLSGETPRAEWLTGTPADLEFGFQTIRVRFESTGAPPRLGLFWSGPGFGREPLSGLYLFHDPPNEPPADFDRGQKLARGLSCAGCHDIPGEEPHRAAALDKAAGNFSAEWLARRLFQDPPDPSGERRMAFHTAARLGIGPEEARAIAAALVSTAPAPSAEAPAPGDVAAGRSLFATVGCVACHQADGLGVPGEFDGGDLSAVATKRPAGFFARWLADPAGINADHQMPVFRLTDEERGHLSAWLATLGRDPNNHAAQAPDGAEVNLGKLLIAEHRCGACHRLPKALDPGEFAPKKPLPAHPLSGGCLAPDALGSHPTFTLQHADLNALRSYVETCLSVPAAAGRPDGRTLFAELGCANCHRRGTTSFARPRLAAAVEHNEELAGQVPALSPPALDTVGDKLTDRALADSIRGQATSLRPWLAVRMPRFRLSDDEVRALAEYFIATDRIPSGGESEPAAVAAPGPHEAEMSMAGRRLVTADGFGCTSCHKIGRVEPAPGPLATRGSELTEPAGRLRREWFLRWVKDPARIVPRMEMPAIKLAVPGVLEGSVANQIEAVWSVLNEPGFEPPEPNPIRVARTHNLDPLRERAVLVTDNFELGGKTYFKPLVIGLPNRHNVFFDLAAPRLVAWWMGDSARERTRGKSWYWEPGGNPIAGLSKGGGEMQIETPGGLLRPLLMGQFPLDVDGFEHVPGGLRITWRTQFARPAGGPRVTLAVAQTWRAEATSGVAGVRRTIEVSGLPDGWSVRMAVPFVEFAAESSPGVFIVGPPGAAASLVCPLGERVRLEGEGGSRWLRLGASPDGTARAEMSLVCNVPADRYEPATFQPPAMPAPSSLSVLPGFEALRLPLPPAIMPTGLAWRPDGRLAFTSLKGEVFQARDTDGDGVEDRTSTFWDGLAAPYGLVDSGDNLLVINKYALLELSDDDRDDQADCAAVLASGWGHTDDYHDWAVGIERDAKGNIYLALPCQQDDRPAEAAVLRGHALRLVPRAPSADDPRAYAVEAICGGLRFPMGLALGQDEALFATDNQGNYTPFNEVNHLIDGGRYGFINKLEKPSELPGPVRAAAIEIPHPWTRSVNGICFLNTPEAVHAERGSIFGPYEGQLVGCEYDTRRLVRMSLERVEGEYQGAVYPFSRPTAGDEAWLLGPIVCDVSPRGDLVVGNIRDSGWGGGNNVGSITRFRPTGDWPFGLAEVRAISRGFSLGFSRPVDRTLAGDPANYTVVSFRRMATPAYGGDDVDRSVARVAKATVSADGLSVHLAVEPLRQGFVYEIRVGMIGPAGEPPQPDQAWYTLRRAVQ